MDSDDSGACNSLRIRLSDCVELAEGIGELKSTGVLEMRLLSVDGVVVFSFPVFMPEFIAVLMDVNDG